MPSQSNHHDTTAVVRSDPSLAKDQNQQKGGLLWNSQYPPAKRFISIPAVEGDSSQEGRSVASTLKYQNSTSSSSLNNSRIADITQRVTSTASATQWRLTSTPTSMAGTSCRSTPTREGT